MLQPNYTWFAPHYIPLFVNDHGPPQNASVPPVDPVEAEGAAAEPSHAPAWVAEAPSTGSAPVVPFADLDPLVPNGGTDRPDVTFGGEISWQGGSGGTPGEQQMPYTVEIMGGSGTFAFDDGTAGRLNNLELVDDRITEVKSDAFGNPFEYQRGQAYEFDGVMTYTANEDGLVGHHVMGHYEAFEGMQVVFDRLVEYEYGIDFAYEGVSSGGLGAPQLDAEWMIEGNASVAMQYVEAGYYLVEVSATFTGEVMSQGREFVVEPAPHEAFFMVMEPDEFTFALPDIIEEGFADMASLMGPVWDSLGHFEGILGEVLAGARDDGYYDTHDALENPFIGTTPLPSAGWSGDDGTAIF